MTLRQRRAFKERKREGMIERFLTFLAHHRRVVLILVVAGIAAIAVRLLWVAVRGSL